MTWTEEALRAVADEHDVDSDGRIALWQERLAGEVALLRELRSAPLTRGEQPSDSPVLARDTERALEARASVVRRADARVDDSPCPGDVHAHVEAALATAQEHANLNSFTALLPDLARSQADDLATRLACGESLPLAGRTVAVKDLIGVQGYATTGGTRALRSEPSDEHAPSVARLVEAGAIVVGMANLHALAYGVSSTSSDVGAVDNPLAPGHLAGGSSGGSAAAVAAGIVDLALGTDTSGSIRIPAALCGVVGLKPTYGRIPLTGVHPLGPSMDHVGPLTRTVDEAAAALEALSTVPFQAADARWTSLAAVTLGVPRQYALDHLDQVVRQSVEQALDHARALGARVVEVDVPSLNHSPATQLATLSAEAFESNRGLLTKHADELPADVRLRLEMGMFRSAPDYVRAQRVRAWMRHEMHAALERCDVLLWPTLPITAPPRGTTTVTLEGAEWTVQAAATRLTMPYNLTGFPALSLPWDTDSSGAGIGMQMGAAPWDEQSLLGVAHALEMRRAETVAGRDPEHRGDRSA